MSNEYREFAIKVKGLTGIDLQLYKEAQMKRRLTSLYEKKRFKNFYEYYQFISTNKEGLNEFLDRMTINVSEFYRNAKRWEILNNKIMPQLLKENSRLKVWSAACSTGEEPYTLALILSQHLPLSNISILATDIDENVIARAKMGVYHERALNEMPVDIKKKHFDKEGEYYRLHDKIKNTVTFKKHNLLADSYEKNFDLVVCRNVLIYFTEEAKDMLYEKFSQSMRKGGIFFVGSTEQIFSATKYQFEVEDTFFYRKM
ncbi:MULTISPECIES: CheR family methyltransferase [Bacillus]|uniref:CheR family methyltransferase n=1 Tax=Bacillus TaxID=1386 RepID=UPI0002E7607F|nr:MULTISPECIES: protein-glutamate O-methyltransferase CheR [Bacillus]